MSCNNHKNYKAKSRPRVACPDCWSMYLQKHLKVDADWDEMSIAEADKAFADVALKIAEAMP